MPNVLRGNFDTKNPVTGTQAQDNTLEAQFEKEAMKRLGGSIAFVSKRKVMWDTKDGVEKKKK